MNSKILRYAPAVLAPLLALGAGTASAQSATMTIPGMGRVLAGDGSKQSLTCKGDAMTISGNGNRVTLIGNCTQVVINGNKNVVLAATVGEIVANGNGNTVSWQKAIKGGKPLLRLTGNGNKVSKR
ncbi:DUF3060 domain-containing protein [Deinococcus sp. UYEF24]